MGGGRLTSTINVIIVMIGTRIYSRGDKGG